MRHSKVFFLARAHREYAAALAWWGKLLSEFPEAGELDGTRQGQIRRLVLRGSRYFVFYRVHTTARRVEILAVWHANRLAPDLE